MQGPNGEWVHKVVIKQEWPKMIGWALAPPPPPNTGNQINPGVKYHNKHHTGATPP